MLPGLDSQPEADSELEAASHWVRVPGTMTPVDGRTNCSRHRDTQRRASLSLPRIPGRAVTQPTAALPPSQLIDSDVELSVEFQSPLEIAGPAGREGSSFGQLLATMSRISPAGRL